jgi:hypothetical protein
VYEYRDENGILLFKKKRFQNKSFEFGRDWDGQWISGVNGAEIPFYRADELAKADPERQLWICEGEKDADRLRDHGLLATTVPCGALGNGQVWKPAYSRLVRRFDHVVICEDNDASGRANVTECGRALRSSGIPDVRAVAFRDLPEHADVSDWLDQGHTVEQLIELAEQTPQWSPPEWPEPIPLTDLRGLPDFPTELLPDWLRDFSDAVATEIQTPRCVPAMITLSVVSASLARKVAVHVRDNWTEPLNLYTATALGPSNLKTPAFKVSLAPMETFERAKTAEMGPEIVKAENARANLQAQLQATRKSVAKAKTEVERRDATRETEKLTKQLAELRVPRAPQLVANDVTEESLGKLLAENDGRIFVASDEGGPFRNMAGRYQKNGAPVFESFKHGHNAGTVRVNRAGREPIHVPNAAITLALMVQPSLLRSLRETSEFRGEGLLARFLYAVPESMVGSRNLRAEGVPLHVAARYRERVNALLSLPFGSDENGATAPHVMELTTDARERLIVFREGLEPRQGRGGDLSHVADWAGKLAGAAARIAALLHLSQLAGHPEPWRTPVTAEAMDAAIAVAREFLIPHALAAFSLIGGGSESDLADEILAWIRRHGHARFTKRELHRHMRRQVHDPREWDAPLALLASNGWIRELASEPGKKGRPSEEYEANPATLAEVSAP